MISRKGTEDITVAGFLSPSSGELDETLHYTPVPQATSTIGRRHCLGAPMSADADADVLSRIERRAAASSGPADRFSLASNASSLGLLPVDSMEEFPDETAAFRRFLERSSSQDSDSDGELEARRRRRPPKHRPADACNPPSPPSPQLGNGLGVVDPTPQSQPLRQQNAVGLRDPVHESEQLHLRDAFRAGDSPPRSQLLPPQNAKSVVDSTPQLQLPRRQIAVGVVDPPPRPSRHGGDRIGPANGERFDETGTFRVPPDSSYLAADLLVRKERELAARAIRRAEQMQQRRRDAKNTTVDGGGDSYERGGACDGMRGGDDANERRDASGNRGGGDTRKERGGGDAWDAGGSAAALPSFLLRADESAVGGGGGEAVARNSLLDSSSFDVSRWPRYEAANVTEGKFFEVDEGQDIDGGHDFDGSHDFDESHGAGHDFAGGHTLDGSHDFDESHSGGADFAGGRVEENLEPEPELLVDLAESCEKPFNPFSTTMADFTISAETFLPADSSAFRAELESDEAAASAPGAGVPVLIDSAPLADISRLADATQADGSAIEAYFRRGTEPLGGLAPGAQRPNFGRIIRSPVKAVRSPGKAVRSPVKAWRAQPPIASIAEVSRSESQQRSPSPSVSNIENVSPCHENVSPGTRNKSALSKNASARALNLSPCREIIANSKATTSPSRLLKDTSNRRVTPTSKRDVGGDSSRRFDPGSETIDKEGAEGRPSTGGGRVKGRALISGPTALSDSIESIAELHGGGVELSAWDGDTESDAESDSGWMLSAENAPSACPHVAALAHSLPRPTLQTVVEPADKEVRPARQVPTPDKAAAAKSNALALSPRSSAGSSSSVDVRVAQRDLVWTAVRTGQNHRKGLVIKNPSDRSVRIVAYVTPNSPFKLAGENGELVERRRLALSGHEACKLSVAFCPVAVGPQAAALHFAPAAAAAPESSRLVRLFGCAGQARLRVIGAPCDAAGRHWVTLATTAEAGSLEADFTLRNAGDAAMFAHLALAADGLRILREDVLRVVPARVVVPPGGCVPFRIIYQGPRAARPLHQLARLTVSWGEESTRLRLRRILRRRPGRAAALDRSFGELPALIVGDFDGEVAQPALDALRDPEECAGVLCDSLRLLHMSVLLERADEDSLCADADATALDETLAYASLRETHDETHDETQDDATMPELGGWSVTPTSVTLTPPAACTVALRNATPRAQTFEVSSSCAWLRAEPAQGCVGPGAAVELALACAGRAVQSATGFIQVMTENDMTEVEVHLRPAKIVALPPTPVAREGPRPQSARALPSAAPKTPRKPATDQATVQQDRQPLPSGSARPQSPVTRGTPRATPAATGRDEGHATDKSVRRPAPGSYAALYAESHAQMYTTPNKSTRRESDGDLAGCRGEYSTGRVRDNITPAKTARNPGGNTPAAAGKKLTSASKQALEHVSTPGALPGEPSSATKQRRRREDRPNDAAELEALPLGPCDGDHSLLAAVFSDNYRIEFPDTGVGRVASFKVSLKNTSEETRTMQIRQLSAPFHATARRYQLKGKWFLRFKVHFKPTVVGVSAQHVFIDPDVGPPLRFLFSGRGVEDASPVA